MDKTEYILNHMLEDLSKHHRNRKELIVEYVNSRLEKSLQNYYEELLSSYDELTRRDAAKVLKKMLDNKGDK